MRARDVMSTPAVTVTPERPVKDAAVLLASRGFTALPVVDCDGSLMVTVHDGTVSMADEFDDPTGTPPPSEPKPSRVSPRCT
jgi:CBS domain-containing protein